MSGTSRSLTVACPKCGERLAVRAADIGKRGKCRRCEAVFRIAVKGAPSPPAAPAVANAPRAIETPTGLDLSDLFEPPKPASVTFPCSLCETRITTASINVGKQIKCPDCGRVNVIPAPVAKPQAAAPAAMSGEQFDLWGVDEGPNPEDLAARSPTLHPVVCQLCQTLMYATDEQVGTKLKCPDCGTLTIAERRKLEKPQGPVLVPDGDEYQLDETSAPPPRQVYRPIEFRDWRGERSDDALADASPRTMTERGAAEEPPRRRRDRQADQESNERLRMPRVPLVQGFWRMLLTSEVLSRGLLLAIALMIAGWFLSWVANAMGSQVFMAIPLFAIGCVFLGLWLLTAMPLCLAIVTESSEGSDRLHDPPSWISMEFAEAFFIAIAAAVSAIPAWLTLKVTGTLPVEAQQAISAGTWLLFFPVVLLSNLEQSSAFAVFSPRLLASLVRCPGPWLLFYVESAILAAAAVVALLGIAEGPEWMIHLGPVVTMSVLFIYMRLIGRLAWWLAETMPAVAEHEPS